MMSRVVRWPVLVAVISACAWTAACEFVIDTRARCATDLDCQATEQCQAQRCYPRTTGSDSGELPDATATDHGEARDGALLDRSALDQAPGSDSTVADTAGASDHAGGDTAIGTYGAIGRDAVSPDRATADANHPDAARSDSVSPDAARPDSAQPTDRAPQPDSAPQHDASVAIDSGSPGGPRLAIISAPQTLAVNACSALATVQAQDGSGNPIVLGADLIVDLNAAPSTSIQFHRKNDPTCTSNRSQQITIPPGSSSEDFHFMGTAAGSVTITVSAPGYADGTQQEIFQ
jgi:hypothetical protein